MDHKISLLDPLTAFEASTKAFLTAIPSFIEVSSMNPQLLPSAVDDISSFLTRLQSIITQLTDVHRTHIPRPALLRNAACSHTRFLPPEILGTIFGFYMVDAVGFESSFVKSMQRLTHVCSLWRRVALGWKSLWCHLDLAEFRDIPLLLKEWIHRSTPVPVHIHNAKLKHREIIEGLMPRIGSLNLYYGSLDALDVSEPNLEHLESLTVDGDWTHDIHDWRMPALRNLHIVSNFQVITMPSSVLSQLQSVTIEWHYRITELYPFLSSLDSLEYLRLGERAAPIEWGSSDQLTLKSLKHLHIGDLVSMEGLTGWICPNLQTLRFDGCYEVDIEEEAEMLPRTWAWATAFLEHSPSLTSLTFKKEHGEDLVWESFLSYLAEHIRTLVDDPDQPTFLPNLKTLKFLGSQFNNNALEQGLSEFLKALYELRNKQSLPPSPGPNTAKVLDQLVIYRKITSTLGEARSENLSRIASMVGLLDVVPDKEFHQLDWESWPRRV